MKELKLYEVLQRASIFLEEYGREKQVAEILLQHYLNVSRTQFYAMMREPLSQEVIHSFYKDIETHCKTGKPVQHMTGKEKFYGRSFTVNEHVLIPRPETEELVQHVLVFIRKNFANQSVSIVDIGTGSGVIAITLALELPKATIYATDISKKAIQVARKNAKNLHADVHFMEGDFLQPVLKHNMHPQIIVSNPPYIDVNEKSEIVDTVIDFDPHIALFADEQGLAAYKKIVNETKKLTELPSLIAFEIGHTQGSAVRSIVKRAYPFADVKIIQDLNGKDRVVLVHLKAK